MKNKIRGKLFKYQMSRTDMKKEMANRRAQEMSTNTIILIVLGVIILVVLLLGFSMGWEKVFPFISSSNIKQVQSSCSLACATMSQYDYCYVERILKDPDKKTEVRTSCNILANIENPNLGRYGLSKCSSLKCDDSKPFCNATLVKFDGVSYIGEEYIPTTEEINGADKTVCDTQNSQAIVLYQTPLANVATSGDKICCLRKA